MYELLILGEYIDMKYFVFFGLFFFGVDLSAQENPTMGEIYDFEVGDLFQYRDQPSQGPHGFRQRVISDKWFSTDLDTVYYESVSSSYRFPECEGCDELVSWGEVDTLFYTHLDSVINVEGQQPIWDENSCVTNFSSLGESYLVYDLSHSCIDTVIQIHENLILSPCPIEYDIEFRGYARSLGMVSAEFEYFDAGAINFYSRLIYFEKSGAQCGDYEEVLGVRDDLLDDIVLVYPNPSNRGMFNLKTNRAIEYEVCTSNGVLIHRSNNFKSSIIDLSTFPSGIYFVAFFDRKGKFIGNERVVK